MFNRVVDILLSFDDLFYILLNLMIIFLFAMASDGSEEKYWHGHYLFASLGGSGPIPAFF